MIVTVHVFLGQINRWFWPLLIETVSLLIKQHWHVMQFNTTPHTYLLLFFTLWHICFNSIMRAPVCWVIASERLRIRLRHCEVIVWIKKVERGSCRSRHFFHNHLTLQSFLSDFFLNHFNYSFEYLLLVGYRIKNGEV